MTDEILLAKRVSERLKKELVEGMESIQDTMYEDVSRLFHQLENIERRIHAIERSFEKFKEVERLEITRAAVAKVLKEGGYRGTD